MWKRLKIISGTVGWLNVAERASPRWVRILLLSAVRVYLFKLLNTVRFEVLSITGPVCCEILRKNLAGRRYWKEWVFKYTLIQDWLLLLKSIHTVWDSAAERYGWWAQINIPTCWVRPGRLTRRRQNNRPQSVLGARSSASSHSSPLKQLTSLEISLRGFKPREVTVEDVYLPR